MKHLFSIIHENNYFTALYLAIKNLKSVIGEHSSDIEWNSFLADKLFGLLNSEVHGNQTRSFFLYREICDLIIFMLEKSANYEFIKYCTDKLADSVLNFKKDKLRAVGDSISNMKINIPEPHIEKVDSESRGEYVEDLIEKYGLKKGVWFGRSCVYEKQNRYIVFKYLREEEDAKGLINEIFWMNKLKEYEDSFFKVPDPLFNGILSSKTNTNEGLHPEGKAIAFSVKPDYYRYPNEKNYGLDELKFLELMEKNAYLTGLLAGKGIIHNALIPLFHNTVQKERREDCGLYMWEKGGRLDNWLGSCKYPNFGFSGLRDFEHIEIFNRTKTLYRNIGNQILGFILVIGSFFRNIGCDKMKDSWKVGEKGIFDGEPIDARELFDHNSFRKILNITLSQYCKGFTGSGSLIKADDLLIDKLIHSMGFDKNMEEIIRVHDQKIMDENEFRNLLISKNIDLSMIPEKGSGDIVVSSGPHLGEFNGKISVPELTDFVIKASSLSILRKFTIGNEIN